MLSSLIRWLFWRRSVLVLGGFLVILACVAFAILIGGGLSFLFGTGAAALLEIEASRVETLSIGVLVMAILWALTTLTR